jgi:hypothetical protein
VDLKASLVTADEKNQCPAVQHVTILTVEAETCQAVTD